MLQREADIFGRPETYESRAGIAFLRRLSLCYKIFKLEIARKSKEKKPKIMPHSVHCQLMQFYYWTEDGEQKHNINKNLVCVWSRGRPNLAGG